MLSFYDRQPINWPGDRELSQSSSSEMTAEITAVRFFVYRVSAGEEAEEEQDDRQTEKSCPCCNAEKLPINFLKGRISPIVPQILGRLHKKKTQQVNKKKKCFYCDLYYSAICSFEKLCGDILLTFFLFHIPQCKWQRSRQSARQFIDGVCQWTWNLNMTWWKSIRDLWVQN